MSLISCVTSRGLASEPATVCSRLFLPRVSSLLLLAMLLSVLLLGVSAGCGKSTPPPPPPHIPAEPKIVSERTETNIFSTNREIVKVKNEGDAGMVECDVYWIDTNTEIKRGESGAEKAVREAFTRQTEPPPRVERKNYRKKCWTSTKMMQKGETAEFTIDLEGHSSLSGYLNVVVFGKQE